MNRFSLIALVAVGIAPAGARADEGMWIFNDFPSAKVKAKHGFAPTQAWLDETRLSAAKYGGGCSASFVSGNGLVLTNHHCARGCIQAVSSAKADYGKNGFFARTEADELRCPALDVRQLTAIEDVTARIDTATKNLADAAYNTAQKAEMSRIEKECSDPARGASCDVVTLWNGGRYHLYRYRRYDDVRLVYAPEAAIAFFGGDPDNFTFPRYDLDMAFVRVYENGKPAVTPHHFRWSPTGTHENDLVFVVGHPGSTQRLQTVAQLEYLRDTWLQNALRTTAELRGQLTEFARRGPEQKRTSQTTLFGVENSLKRLTGMHEALLDKAFFQRKTAEETALRAKVAKNPKWKKLYGGAWDAVAKAVDGARRLGKVYGFAEGGRAFQSSLFHHARTLVRAADERGKPNEERLREFRDAALPMIEARLGSTAPLHRDLEELTLAFSLSKLREQMGADDPFVKKVLAKQSPEDLARVLVTGSKLDDPAVRKKLWEGGRTAIDVSNDPMIRLARAVDADSRAIRKRFEDEVEAPEKKNEELIARVRFQIEGTSNYPDATGTLRVSYGAARGYEVNGRRIPWSTEIAGAFERATGREPFALPKSWLDAQATLKGDLQLNFVADTDIIGGNSGSPVVNKERDLVGLAFDGNIQSLGGAYTFDPAVNRTVSVSSAAMLEALRVVYKADRIVQELVPVRSASR